MGFNKTSIKDVGWKLSYCSISLTTQTSDRTECIFLLGVNANLHKLRNARY